MRTNRPREMIYRINFQRIENLAPKGSASTPEHRPHSRGLGHKQVPHVIVTGRTQETSPVSNLFRFLDEIGEVGASRPISFGRSCVRIDGGIALFAGPIIARELLTAPRPPRYYATRALSAGLLFILMWTAWQNLIGWRK